MALDYKSAPSQAGPPGAPIVTPLLLVETLLQVMTAEQWLKVAAALERVKRQEFGEVSVSVNKGHAVHVRTTFSEYLRPGPV